MTESIAFNYIFINTNKYAVCSERHAAIVYMDIK